MMNLEDILLLALQNGASDIHLKAGMTPIIRRHGQLRPLASHLPPMTGEQVEELALKIMDPQQQERFKRNEEVDLGYGISGMGRFRVSAFKQRGTSRLVLRHIPHKVPNFEDLNLPPIVEKLAQTERGLILVTGVAGSGKSSTLAAMVDSINQRANKHILTIEDPIEFLIRDRKSLITQREIGVDSSSFANALRAGLRQDPDVILIGEMRDRETIEIAMLAAETGHLVVSTLHTLDATETINRILANFEAAQQPQVRLQLGAVLKAVISQRLCQRKDETGSVPAVEVLVNTPRVRHLIEKAEQTADIKDALEEGQTAYGMQSFDQSLMDLLSKDLISYEEALLHCARPEDFRIRYEGITSMDGKKWAQSVSRNKQQNDQWQEMSEVEIVIPQDSSEDAQDEGLAAAAGQKKSRKK